MSYYIEKNVLNQQVNKEIDVCLFEKITSPIPTKNLTLSHSRFKTLMSQGIQSDSKDGLLLGPYLLDPIYKRTNHNIEKISLLVFDIDDPRGFSLNEIIKMVKQFDGFIHTTWSHTIDNPRYRLIIFLSRALNPKEFNQVRECFLFLHSEIASIIDPSCSDISRCYYLYSYPAERKTIANFIKLDGKPLDVESMQLIKDEASPKIDFNRLEQGQFKKGHRHHAMMQYIGALAARGFDGKDIRQKVLRWNLTNEEPKPEDEINKAIQYIIKKENITDDLSRDKATETAPKFYKLLSAAPLVFHSPPERLWLFPDFLPCKIVGALIAAGGTGKSYFAIHMAIALAAGISLFKKFEPLEAKHVVYISGEDSIDELHRRLYWATRHLPEQVKERVGKNISFIDLADAYELFTHKKNHSDVEITEVVKNLIGSIQAKSLPNLGLIIIDPVSRFRGGEENLAQDTTRFVQALQVFRDQLSVSVLALHHVNKGARFNGTGQNNARGSSAFVDGVRLVLEMNQLNDDEVRKLYGENFNRPIVHLSCVKTNYTKHFEPLMLTKDDQGALETIKMMPGEHQQLAILKEINFTSLSKTQFKETYGNAKTGLFGLSEKELVKKLSQYEREGFIQIPDRRPMELTPKGQSFI
jgi:hypothetical protein